MRTEFIRVGGLAVIVFICLVAVEVALVAVVAGSGANDVSAPFVQQFSMLRTLWGSNPMAALPLTAQTPLLLIARQEPADTLQTWGLFYFPISIIAHLAIAIVTAWIWCRRAGRTHYLLWLTSGVGLLAFAVTYTRFATCCTGGPRWALEIGLYALAFDPTRTLLDWPVIYTRLETYFPFLQIATAALGIACIVVAALKQIRQDGRH